MSFLSMLNMARGKEPDPASQPSSSQPDNSKLPTKPSRPANMTPKSPRPATKRTGSYASGIDATKPALYTPSAARTSPVAHPAAKRAPTSFPSSRMPPPKPTPTKSTSSNSANRSTPIAHLKPPSEAVPPEQVSRKKLSFKDVLKRADSIDRSKFEISLKAKDPKKDIPRPSRRRLSEEPAPRTSKPLESQKRIDTPKRGVTSHNKQSDLTQRARPASRSAKSSPMASPSSINRSAAPKLRQPAAFAQPFPELAAKMQQRSQLKDKRRQSLREKRRYDEDEDDLGDFVVSEDEEEDPSEYSSEIRRLFKRSDRADYYDSGSESDMEAGGADILDEERRSAAQARREDILEEQKLAERALQKRQRLH